MTDAVIKTPHEWVVSQLGHGEWQCVHCFATNREIAVIGDPNHCPDAHKRKFPATAKLGSRLVHVADGDS